MFPPLRLRSVTALLGITALSALGVVEFCSRSAAEGPHAVRPLPTLVDSPPPPNISIPRPDPKHLPKLSPEFPGDLRPSPTSTANAPAAGNLAESFAWDTFVALNWPTGPNGESDRAQLPGLNGDHTTVWDFWPDAARLFPPDGREPAPWGSPAETETRPAALRDLPPGTRILTRTGKGLASLAPEAPAGPLVDQNGRHVRLETRVNRPVFDAIVAQRLYRRDVRETTGPISFSAGETDDGATRPGSIRVQAAWKILSPAEVAAGRFHAVEAVLYTPPAESPTGQGVVERATVGLVGLHIVRKNPSAPGWVWSTFEHTDNCPTVGEPADRAAYNFYDKASPALPANEPPAPPCDPTATEPAARRPQIVRQVPIPIATRALNVAYQAAFRAINPASPWQHYELVGVQLSGTGAPSPSPEPLANTTLETYLAATRTPAASCIDCHAKAAAPSGASADSSFLLRFAP